MSAKQKSNTQTQTEITLKGDALNDPLIRRYLKSQEKKAERSKIEEKVPKLLQKAKDLFGREFSSVAAILKYVSPRKKTKKKGKRAGRITKEQKAQVLELRKGGGTNEQIAEQLGLMVPQVKRVV